MLKLTSTAAVVALALVTPSQAVIFSAAQVSVDPIVENTASRLSGAERLRRLMRTHIRAGNPITQSVRDATGNPNITVIDRRYGDPYQTYQCSYFNLRKGQRVLKCD
ncbi:MAG: hypothetical protein ABJM29_15830 [Rhizobiaceae bacterium]